jgi:hypothetical protein
MGTASLPRKIGNYKSMLRNILEERRYYLHRSGNVLFTFITSKTPENGEVKEANDLRK